MKILLIALIMAAIGGALGIFGGIRFEEMRHARQDIEQMLRSDRNERYNAAFLSLAVLDTLAAGQAEKAKSLLAQQVALYHHFFKNHERRFPRAKGWYLRLTQSAQDRQPSEKHSGKNLSDVATPAI